MTQVSSSIRIAQSKHHDSLHSYLTSQLKQLSLKYLLPWSVWYRFLIALLLPLFNNLFQFLMWTFFIHSNPLHSSDSLIHSKPFHFTCSLSNLINYTDTMKNLHTFYLSSLLVPNLDMCISRGISTKALGTEEKPLSRDTSGTYMKLCLKFHDQVFSSKIVI